MNRLPLLASGSYFCTAIPVQVLKKDYFFLVPHPLLVFLGASFAAGADFAGFASVFFVAMSIISFKKIKENISNSNEF